MMPNLPQSLPTLFPISPWHPCILIGTWAHTSYVFCHAVLAAVLLLLSHLDSALYIYIYIYEWVYCLLLWSYKSPHTNACYCLLFVALLPHIRVSIVTAIISGHLNVFHIWMWLMLVFLLIYGYMRICCHCHCSGSIIYVYLYIHNQLLLWLIPSYIHIYAYPDALLTQPYVCSRFFPCLTCPHSSMLIDFHVYIHTYQHTHCSSLIMYIYIYIMPPTILIHLTHDFIF